MVIHEDDPPVEVSIVKNNQMEAKKYVIVKNHVRELRTNEDNQTSSHSNQSSSSETEKKVKNKKSKKKQSIAESDHNTNSEETEICQSDLEELRTVYKKCKEVIYKIETKYGHLLDLDESGPSIRADKCYCSANTKIIFDENGQQISTAPDPDYHVCAKKKRRHSYNSDTRNLQMEYAENDVTLSDDLQTLSSILQDPNTVATLRNAVINKIRMIRQEYANEIRFNKHALIEKSKTDSSEVFDFKGTNLSSLPGYPDWK